MIILSWRCDCFKHALFVRSAAAQFCTSLSVVICACVQRYEYIGQAGSGAYGQASPVLECHTTGQCVNCRLVAPSLTSVKGYFACFELCTKSRFGCAESGLCNPARRLWTAYAKGCWLRAKFSDRRIPTKRSDIFGAFGRGLSDSKANITETSLSTVNASALHSTKPHHLPTHSSTSWLPCLCQKSLSAFDYSMSLLRITWCSVILWILPLILFSSLRQSVQCVWTIHSHTCPLPSHTHAFSTSSLCGDSALAVFFR